MSNVVGCMLSLLSAVLLVRSGWVIGDRLHAHDPWADL